MQRSAPLWLVHGLLLVAMMSIGAGFVATKVVMGHMSPLAWVFVRITATAALLLLMFGPRLVRARLTWRDQGMLAICALLGIVANQALFAVGLRHTTPAHASLINGLVPLITLLIAATASLERLNRRKLVAIGLALPGLACLMGVDQLSWSSSTWQGDALVLANSASYALYLVLSRSVFRRHGWQVAVTGMFLWAVPAIASLGLTQATTIAWQGLPTSIWLLMAFIVLGPSVGAYITNAWALQRLDASRVALYGYVPPLAAVLLAVTCLGEPVTLRLLTSMGLIFVGLGVAVIPPSLLTTLSEGLQTLRAAVGRRLQPTMEAPSALTAIGR